MSVLKKCTAFRGSRHIRAAAQSCSCSPLRDDLQPATDDVPIPAALLPPDAIKGFTSFVSPVVNACASAGGGVGGVVSF